MALTEKLGNKGAKRAGQIWERNKGMVRIGIQVGRDVERKAWRSALVWVLCEKNTVVTMLYIDAERHISGFIFFCDRKWRVDDASHSGAGILPKLVFPHTYVAPRQSLVLCLRPCVYDFGVLEALRL